MPDCWTIVATIFVAMLIAVGVASCMDPRRLSFLTQRRQSDRGTRVNAADIRRPAGKQDVVPLAAGKMYGARNVLSDDAAGFSLDNAAFNNMTVGSDTDPIHQVAKMFPGRSRHEQMVAEVGIKNFPLDPSFVDRVRQTASTAANTMKYGISESAMKAIWPLRGGLPRNQEQLADSAAKRVADHAASNPQIMQMITNAPESFHEFMARGAQATHQTV